jgi:predicted dehydrogenase
VTGIAVIGAGYWGKNLVRNVARLGRLAAVCDTSEAIRARVASDHPDVPITGDLEGVLARGDVGAVMIAVPAPAHFAVAKAALEAGKHVYVEKPITLDVGEAETLVAMAKERDLRLMVGHLLLFHPCVGWLKDTIDSGDLGRVLYLTSKRVNLGKVRPDENAMWSLAPHDVSVALHLLGGTPSEVSAQGFCYLQQRTGIEDVVFMTLRFADGRAAHIHVSWLDPHKERSLTVVGSRKMITFDDMSSSEKLRIYDKGVDGVDQLDQAPAYASYAELLTLRSGDVLIPQVPMKEPLALLCQHFAHCIDTGETPITDGAGGVEVLRVLAAAQRSLESGGQPMAIAGPS